MSIPFTQHLHGGNTRLINIKIVGEHNERMANSVIKSGGVFELINLPTKQTIMVCVYEGMEIAMVRCSSLCRESLANAREKVIVEAYKALKGINREPAQQKRAFN